MQLFKRKSRVEKISLILDRDHNIYHDYEEKTQQKWLKDLDKVFRDMKKNGVPEELKGFLAYRYPFHCLEYNLIDMEETIYDIKEMNVTLSDEGVLPPSIGRFTNLESLDLAFKGIKELPEEVANLKKLKILILGGNPIDIFPNVISNLYNLEELLLGKCNISKIPDNIVNLRSLKILHLINVNFNDFPIAITHIPNLIELNLQDNQISSIPLNIKNLKTIETLTLFNNPISNISIEIKELKRLKKIDLRKTSLTQDKLEKLKIWLPKTEIVF